MNITIRKIVFSVLLITIIITTSFFYLWTTNWSLPNFAQFLKIPSNESDVAVDSTENLIDLEKSIDDGDNKTTLSYIDELLKDTTNDFDRDTLLIKRANTLSENNNTPDTIKALDMLADIIDKELTSDLHKGWALSVVLNIYYNNTSNSVVIEHIRSLPIFSEDTHLPVSDFLIKVATMSDSYYSSVFSKLYIAAPYAYLIDSDSNLEQEKQIEYAKGIVDLVDYSDSMDDDQFIFVANAKLWQTMANHMRGTLLSTVANTGYIDASQPNMYFERVLATAEENPNNIPIQNIACYSLLYYAMNLNESGQTDKATEVLSMLVTKYQQTPYLTFYSYLSSVSTNEYDIHHQKLVKLTELDESFNSLISSLNNQ